MCFLCGKCRFILQFVLYSLFKDKRLAYKLRYTPGLGKNSSAASQGALMFLH